MKTSETTIKEEIIGPEYEIFYSTFQTQGPKGQMWPGMSFHVARESNKAFDFLK